ncbi:nucleoside deaminase [Citroniella saccharovorans]|uniref:tRNA-specific adenosine deaminase n=1 Tax=Citroniella saccharovorans TaxID=2053367 RepID=A0AAW9MP34_9FIRM|nr:nucleoside deaminase [Citroniella saccharovorans]MEB3428809.1 nucleoside deaminase [Citroniella saccharovorans]
MQDQDIYFMGEAIKEARKAEKLDEVPIGAVVVFRGEIIARAYNTVETKNLATSHAEINAIIKASEYLESWRLLGCTLYVTLEPCLMCLGAIIKSRIPRLVFGAYDKNSGYVISNGNILENIRDHKFTFEGGIEERECQTLLRDFFKKLRDRRENECD